MQGEALEARGCYMRAPGTEPSRGAPRPAAWLVPRGGGEQSLCWGRDSRGGLVIRTEGEPLAGPAKAPHPPELEPKRIQTLLGMQLLGTGAHCGLEPGRTRPDTLALAGQQGCCKMEASGLLGSGGGSSRQSAVQPGPWPRSHYWGETPWKAPTSGKIQPVELGGGGACMWLAQASPGASGGAGRGNQTPGGGAANQLASN